MGSYDFKYYCSHGAISAISDEETPKGQSIKWARLAAAATADILRFSKPNEDQRLVMSQPNAYTVPRTGRMLLDARSRLQADPATREFINSAAMLHGNGRCRVHETWTCNARPDPLGVCPSICCVHTRRILTRTPQSILASTTRPSTRQ